MNRFGNDVNVNLWGSSHGPYVGCIIEGLGGGLEVDSELMREDMSLRMPKGRIGTQRREKDEVLFASGITEGVTNGDPISIMIANQDVRSRDYEQFLRRPRPGHADMTAVLRNPCHDIRGGGMYSGRLTAPLVAAGSLCRMILRDDCVSVSGFSRAIGGVVDHSDRDPEEVVASRGFDTRACTSSLDSAMEEAIIKAGSDGDSVGGVVECRIDGLPAGVGEPWFDTFDGELAKAMFSIPAMRAFEIGDGIWSSGSRGSENNDPFTIKGREIGTESNHHGGVLGGRSSGMPLVFRCFFKPTPSISKMQRTVDLTNLEETSIEIEGRHDPCIVPRAVAVVEAMACIVTLDLMKRGGFIEH